MVNFIIYILPQFKKKAFSFHSAPCRFHLQHPCLARPGLCFADVEERMKEASQRRQSREGGAKPQVQTSPRCRLQFSHQSKLPPQMEADE